MYMYIVFLKKVDKRIDKILQHILRQYSTNKEIKLTFQKIVFYMSYDTDILYQSRKILHPI